MGRGNATVVDDKERVTLDDVVEVLAKHSASPNDPDDADKLSRFNQQVRDDQAQQQPSSEEDEEQKKEAPSEGRGRKTSGGPGTTPATKEGP